VKAVITFHRLAVARSPLSYPPSAFRIMLETLSGAGIAIVPLQTLLGEQQGPAVALTFDDGFADLFEAGLPVLREFGAPAHLFLTTGRVGLDNGWPSQPPHAPLAPMLDWVQIEALQRDGMFIEGHTNNHPDLRDLSPDDIEAEMDAADTLIERRLGRRPAYFAYPYGRYNDRVRRAARRRYVAAFSTRLGFLRPGQPFDALPRLDSHYLRSRRVIELLTSPVGNAYIGLRGAMRQIRGTQ
jgi:peptidoglycan/xylan/chitin deacetylase (PgdA/CDA1 family)